MCSRSMRHSGPFSTATTVSTTREESLFINLFDIQRTDAAEHFTKFVMLDHLRRVPDGLPNYGFTSVNMLASVSLPARVFGGVRKEALGFLFAQRYCEARAPVETWDNSTEEVRNHAPWQVSHRGPCEDVRLHGRHHS